MTQLTGEAVRGLTFACLFKEDEPTDDAIVVDGIIAKFSFHPERIKENASAIGELLAELPDEFHATRGHGGSFLNACMDRRGNQWTDFHQDMEALFCLGAAAGKAKWLLPREYWRVLPGSMPYVVVLP